MTGQSVRQFSTAPDNSLEAKAFAGLDFDTDYLSLTQLRNFGTIPARLLGSSFKTARWSEVVDGVLIFREEHPPDFVRH
jgi:hypothetical protein